MSSSNSLSLESLTLAVFVISPAANLFTSPSKTIVTVSPGYISPVTLYPFAYVESSFIIVAGFVFARVTFLKLVIA